MSQRLWGGFVDGKLDWREADDLWGGGNIRMVPMLFKSRRQARAQYQDVRPVEIAFAERDLTKMEAGK